MTGEANTAAANAASNRLLFNIAYLLRNENEQGKTSLSTNGKVVVLNNYCQAYVTLVI